MPSKGRLRLCHRCKSPNHLVAVCTRERHPKRPPRSFLQASTPSPTPLNPPAPPAAVCAAAEMDGVGLGDPSLRTEEDTCYIATSYDLDRARLDWESSAIVAWTLSAPSGADRSDVEDVFCRKYRLRPSELVVSSHFPEQYIVKFSSAELRDRVMRTERCCFKLDGLDVHFRPWRAVSHGYNADLHYRAHVLVDGLPPFAWRPEIVDQLVGRNCAVQRFDDGFTTMEVTSSFGMWVWTPSPRRIAKAMWCTFVNKAPCGLSSRIRIDEDRPDQWKRGMTFRVLLHIDRIEDFNGAPVLDGDAPISDFRPRVHALPPCHLGTIDGMPVDAGAGSVLPAAIPPLGDLRPRDKDARDQKDLGRFQARRGDSRRSRSRPAPEGSRRSRSRPADGTEARRSRSRPADGVEARRSRSRGYVGHDNSRRSRSRSREERRRSRSRAGRRCDDRRPTTRHPHDDDGDADRHSPRHARDRSRARDSGRRAPLDNRRCSHGHHRSSRHHNSERGHRSYNQKDATPAVATPPALASVLVQLQHSVSAAPETALHSATMKPLQPMTPTTPSAAPTVFAPGQLLAAQWALGASPNSPMLTSLGRASPHQEPCRDWSLAIKGVPDVLNSKLASLPPSVEAAPQSTWEDEAPVEECPMAAPTCQASPLSLLLQPHVPEVWDDDMEKVASDALGHEVALLPLHMQEPNGQLGQAVEAPSDPTLLELETPSTELESAPAETPFLSSVEDLFDRPPVPLLPRPAAITPRPRPAVAVPPSEARRSERLRAKPVMHAMDKAIQVLLNKMGCDAEGLPLIQAREKYISKFKTQLPDKTIEGLAMLFKLNVRSIMDADNALIAMGGAGGADSSLQKDFA